MFVIRMLIDFFKIENCGMLVDPSTWPSSQDANISTKVVSQGKALEIGHKISSGCETVRKWLPTRSVTEFRAAGAGQTHLCAKLAGHRY